jgi:ERCC4-type nuclease
MAFTFILDTRERYITELFKERSIYFPEPKPQLDLGDILITNDKSVGKNSDDSNFATSPDIKVLANKLLGGGKKTKDSDEKISNSIDSTQTITLTIERKTFTDLKASMADGRYHEQKSRYLQLPKGTVFYILEDNDSQFKMLDYSTYLGMYVHTIMRDQITVFVTRSMEETVDLLVKMKDTVEKFGINYIDRNPCTIETTQKKKKKAKGLEIYIQQLQCYPGISKTKAAAIAEHYGCFSDLATALSDGSFKVKGVGPVLIAGMKEGTFFSQARPDQKKRAKIIFE